MSLTHDDYAIAWICALPLEVAAARVMLDKTHSPLPQHSSDPNAYALGELNGHHIVIACLPAGVYGTVSATAVVSRMRSTFPRLQYALMVGIGGGVPNKANDIRLGDVVVSKPIGTYSGVVQYDYGKAIQGGIFQPTGTLNKPPKTLLMHMSQLEAQQMTEGRDAVSKIVFDALKQNPHMAERFSPPKPQMDLLFLSGYRHAKRDEGCDKCDKDQLVHRQVRNTRSPYIHYGLIASGDQVMKDSETRDCLAQQHGILCFEMEAAGLMDELPTLVIRGICDYCDSHKQKEWQGYAALTAAAYAKWLLSVVPGCHTDPQVTRKVRHWMVPFARNTKFVGRQKELTELERTISVQDGPTRVAITGLGGVGKTQIALEVAYRVRERDNECSIFWVPCTSHAMIEQTFLTIAQVLGISGVKSADAKEQIRAYLSSERGGRWLLIFDNADDAELWLAGDRTDPALEDFIPQSEQGRIIFTSRNMELAVDLAFSNIIAIPDIDPETAAQILEKSLARKELLNDRTTMTALLKQLAYFPLAIVQASAYINKKRLGLSSYSALLKETEEEAVELLSEDFRDPGRYRDIQNPVMTTWLISFNQIQQQDQLAADYLSFIACIDPRKVPQSLLPSHAAKQQADALGLLNAYSFINSQDADISMHRLVHMASRNWLKTNRLFSYWIRRVADQLKQVFPDDHHTNRQLWREYLPHALALVREKEFKEFQKDCIYLIWNIANCLARDGRFHEAEVLYSQLMQMNQVETGAEHSSTLAVMSDLALIYMYQGRWNEAEKLNTQVTERTKTVLGVEDPGTLVSMGNLAATYRNLGRWNEAEKLEMQVMEARKTVLGAEHHHTLFSMANLSITYQDQGRWNEAERLTMQVLQTRRRVLGAEHPDTLVSMGHLAQIYIHQGRRNEAEKLEVQVTEIFKMVLGPEHPDTLTSMANLAVTYGVQGRWNEAETLNMQVIKTRKTVLGAEHPHTLSSMANLAVTYRNQGRWDIAEKLQVQVMEVRKTVLGAEHPDTLTSMSELAAQYQNQGRWNEAEKLGLHVLETRKTVLGAEHPHTLSSMANLAVTYRNQGRWDVAEKLQVQVMEARKTVLGAEHPDTLTSMSELAAQYQNQGRWNEAEKLGLHVLETRKTVLGAEHPHTLSSMANLAVTYRNQGRWDVAEKLQVQVMEARKTVLGAEHPDTLTSMSELAAQYQNQGRWNEAEKLGLHVLETRKIVLGAEHPDTLVSMAYLALVDMHYGRWDEAEKLNTQILEIAKSVLGAEHSDTLTSMANLAATYRNQGQWNEAEKLELQILETRKSVLGAKHPDTLTSMADLAATYQDMGQWNEAEKLGLQVWETRKAVLGAEHPHTLVSMAYLALIDMHHGRWNEAEKLNAQILETTRSVLGAEHPDTLTYMANLAHTWKSLGKLQDSLTLMEKCSLLRTKVLGSDHPDTKSSARVVADWKDEHNAPQGQQLQSATIQIRPSQLPQKPLTSPRIAAAAAQRHSFAGLSLSDHPLIIASRTLSLSPHSQDLYDVD
ncbi:hypothetical protein PENFLA_c002G04777 [Penicillium flavigenum]|uniref:AAA+ ATPase domain-containing protein n=1 Tax=Penicillium flavigenum TaxID=254877 RepID=A0A1V6TXB7_9EURO|nr:hypothetical protein PENFLA_c002G04777 [Penicillium flavigenum]